MTGRLIITDRGFKGFDSVPSTHGGGVRVYESSAADAPHIWLAAESPEDLNRPGGLLRHTSAHLRLEDAVRLRDQLTYLIEHHYQLPPEPVAAPVEEAQPHCDRPDVHRAHEFIGHSGLRQNCPGFKTVAQLVREAAAADPEAHDQALARGYGVGPMTEEAQLAPTVIATLVGGPWAGMVEMDRIVGPVFAAGHPIGNHYWLDTKSDPPAYHWYGPAVDPLVEAVQPEDGQ